MSDADPFGTPESAEWLRTHRNEGRRHPYDPERMAANDRAERRLRLQEERADRDRARGATRPRSRPQSSRRSTGARLPSVTAQDAERTLAWQLVTMWALMLANDLSPGGNITGGAGSSPSNTRSPGLPKPRQFLAAALVWIVLSFPGQSSNRGLQHGAILLGWLIVLAYAIRLVSLNPGIFQWIANIAGSPNDLFPGPSGNAWNAATIQAAEQTAGAASAQASQIVNTWEAENF